jgi:hypothetical protein
MKHLQYNSETPKTLKTYVCNMRFQRNISLLLGQTEAHRCVEVTSVELTGNAELGGDAQRARLGQCDGGDDAEAGGTGTRGPDVVENAKTAGSWWSTDVGQA